MHRVAIVLALTSGIAAADPSLPLGESSRGRAWWDESSSLTVTPIWAVNRAGHSFVYEWEASLGGVSIDHARFYELVGRPDLSRTMTLRRGLGALALAGGITAGALGMDYFIRGHDPGIALLAGGVLTSYVGLYFVLTPDPVSATEAKQLVDSHRGVAVGFAGRF
jgi:hypothetical protein